MTLIVAHHLIEGPILVSDSRATERKTKNPSDTATKILPLINDCINPKTVFGYMFQESRSQTPKFVQVKKKRLAEIPVIVANNTLFFFNFKSMVTASAGIINPLQVNINILVFPIIKSEIIITIRVKMSVDFLFK